MVFGPKILLMKAALILAAAPASAGGETCTVHKAPAITIKVETEDIDYDYSQNAKALGLMKNDTVSPYAPGADTVSGGLREDHPEIRSDISWELMQEPRRKIGCLSYSAVNIVIHLAPKIYVAKEFNTGACREAILQHERRHVEVDRQVMNKFGASMGRAVQVAVNKAGALGPFPLGEQEKMKTLSSKPIEDALNSQKLLMEAEMRRLQSQVDSLAEYQRVSAQCRGIKLLE